MIGGLTGFVSNGTTTRTVERKGNTTRTVIHMRDHDGKDRGTISYTRRTTSYALRHKRLQYNFKEISSQIMRAKTPGAASQVASRARRRIGQLLRQKKNSEIDEAEIEAALLHAKQMERVARKRKKNLEIEERAAQGIEEKEQEELPEENQSAQTDSAQTSGDAAVGSGTFAEATAENSETIPEGSPGDDAEALMNGMSEADYEKAMRELEQAMKEMEQIEESAEDFAETVDELSEAISGDMEPEDLEEMKKKHRADEQRDIVRADMKYLKAIFDRLAREKAQVKAAAALSSLASSAPAQAPHAASPASGSSRGSASGSGGHNGSAAASSHSGRTAGSGGHLGGLSGHSGHSGSPGGSASPAASAPASPAQGNIIDVTA